MSKRLMVRAGVLSSILLIPLLIYLAPSVVAFFLGIIGALAPLWLPLLVLCIGVPVWLVFVRSHFISAIPYTIIELKPGAETPRTARAMELVFYSLYHRVDISLFEEYVLGQMRMPWSFEIVAHKGLVRFFLHVPTAHRAAVESRIRSEYRDVDIDQTRDYAREIAFQPGHHALYMREFTLVKSDPYPLKTYVAHESENRRRDAFEELLEEISQASEHEYVCVQLILRPHQRERRKFMAPAKDYLHEDAHHEIVALLGHGGELAHASEEVKRRVNAIESALKKPSFDCGLRVMYVAEQEHAAGDEEERIAALFERFNDAELNAFAPYDPKERIGWPLSEVFLITPHALPEYLLQLYRRRAFFGPPYQGRAFVLNTEELATVFHIPHVARASTLSAMRGLRLEPPANLPV